MPFININIHLVWATKNRIPFLNTLSQRKEMWTHIKNNSLKQGILIDTINGHSDHCHCIVSLKHDQTISKIAQLLKGEASHWKNLQQTSCAKFEWQEGYYAAGVSESGLDALRKYINNQEEHHRKISFVEEIEKFMFLWKLK